MSAIINILLFILIISVVVFIHELGHFLMAKWNGVTVHEFALGMGPVLFSKKKNGTSYAVRAVPIGGFVSMEGENEESEDEGSFSKKSPLRRLSILLAGIFNNFLLGFVLLFIYFAMTGVVSNVIDSPLTGRPADAAGLMAGDRIVEINGAAVASWEDILTHVSQAPDGRMQLKIQRQDTSDKASSETLTISLQGEREENGGRYLIGIKPLPVKDLSKVFGYTIFVFLSIFTGVFDLLKNIFNPRIAKEVVGPIGLYQVVGDVRQTGMLNLVFLTGYISVNIGIVNLLPIPAFDGGRSLMVLAELVTGRKLNRKLENALIMGGFAVILFLVAFTFYNDIARIFRG